MPSCFSFGAKKLIKRILNPNPLTRIKISEILQDEWFKKEYHQPSFAEDEDVNLDDVDAAFNNSEKNLVTERRKKPVSMNAFELISGSRGFSLDSLFQK
ncbi:CBL-interacting serine/threonine-protein kinase 9-like [Amaranthus tricolor]|uniref:CBL-interacting serine/threonine-protein kinase 9-like n=1 Tax=Amaranthus tricolor TaxID=29722 RepID=UPI00258D5648|nr:CBL-interacting serine/threonine-protein kinase 9-like [Amaranthus tricolor]